MKKNLHNVLSVFFFFFLEGRGLFTLCDVNVILRKSLEVLLNA